MTCHEKPKVRTQCISKMLAMPMWGADNASSRILQDDLSMGLRYVQIGLRLWATIVKHIPFASNVEQRRFQRIPEVLQIEI